MTEKVPTLSGKAAENFWKYDSRELTMEEKKSLKEAHEFYKKHCPA
jgi:hypothetical protein